jgi:hypothetical protein
MKAVDVTVCTENDGVMEKSVETSGNTSALRLIRMRCRNMNSGCKTQKQPGRQKYLHQISGEFAMGTFSRSFSMIKIKGRIDCRYQDAGGVFLRMQECKSFRQTQFLKGWQNRTSIFITHWKTILMMDFVSKIRN